MACANRAVTPPNSIRSSKHHMSAPDGEKIMERVGFIGLDRMGRPMASNLQRKGFPLHVLDINPEPVAELAALGASAAQTLADLVANSDIIVPMLPTYEAVLGPVHAPGRQQKGT